VGLAEQGIKGRKTGETLKGRRRHYLVRSSERKKEVKRFRCREKFANALKGGEDLWPI
jgi:hypothetical protein